MGCCPLTSRVRSRSGWLRRSQSTITNNKDHEELDKFTWVEESSIMNKGFDVPSVSISAEALAHLGDGEIAYIKTIRSEDVPAMFPQAPEIAPGLKLFALHAADGTPIMITDSREAAVAVGTLRFAHPRAISSHGP